MPDKKSPHYHDHRKRLRARFLSDFGQSMADYELLELLLCAAIPRRDVKPLAKTLLSRFGSLAGVLSANRAELEAIPQIGEGTVVLVKLTRAIALRQLRTKAEKAHILSSWQAVVDYCRAAMMHEKTEQLRILFLNNRNRLLADEVQQTGTINHTPIYPREVAKRALELGATALILVHNHPSGDPTPSKDDIQTTRLIKEALSHLDIVLHDHILIAGAETVSLKSQGLV